MHQQLEQILQKSRNRILEKRHWEESKQAMEHQDQLLDLIYKLNEIISIGTGIEYDE